jgi:hypothetical protein
MAISRPFACVDAICLATSACRFNSCAIENMRRPLKHGQPRTALQRTFLDLGLVSLEHRFAYPQALPPDRLPAFWARRAARTYKKPSLRRRGSDAG